MSASKCFPIQFWHGACRETLTAGVSRFNLHLCLPPEGGQIESGNTKRQRFQTLPTDGEGEVFPDSISAKIRSGNTSERCVTNFGV